MNRWFLNIFTVIVQFVSFINHVEQDELPCIQTHYQRSYMLTKLLSNVLHTQNTHINNNNNNEMNYYYTHRESDRVSIFHTPDKGTECFNVSTSKFKSCNIKLRIKVLFLLNCCVTNSFVILMFSRFEFNLRLTMRLKVLFSGRDWTNTWYINQ